MADQELVLYSGLPASGKSTAAREWLGADPTNRRRLNWDDYRLELFGPDWIFNRRQEKEMQVKSRFLVRSWLEDGYSVVIDNTNLIDTTRKSWETLAHDYRITYAEQEFDTPVEECCDRDRRREGKARVGRAVIERMALTTGFIDWTDTNLYDSDFVVVDMDGTMANCDARRKAAFLGPTVHKMDCTDTTSDRQCPQCGGVSRKDWDLFEKNVINDPPIQPIIDLVEMLEREYDVIVVSGRNLGKAGIGTEDWLENRCPFGVKHLFMRASNDSRHDYIIKQEILDLLPKDRIKYVIDDRNQVVDMWRKNGLTCLQVANGDF